MNRLITALLAIGIFASFFAFGCGYTKLRAPRTPSDSPKGEEIEDKWLRGEISDEDFPDVEIINEGPETGEISPLDKYDPYAPGVRNRRSYPGDYGSYNGLGYYDGYGSPLNSGYYGDTGGYYGNSGGYYVPPGYELVPINDPAQTDQNTVREEDIIARIDVPAGHELVKVRGSYELRPIPGYQPEPIPTPQRTRTLSIRRSAEKSPYSSSYTSERSRTESIRTVKHSVSSSRAGSASKASEGSGKKAAKSSSKKSPPKRRTGQGRF